MRAWASLGVVCIWWHILYRQPLRNKEEACFVLQEGVKCSTRSCPHSYRGLKLSKWSILGTLQL